MKAFLIIFFTFVTSMVFGADVKLSQLPLNSTPATIAAGDSFPYVQANGPVTKRMAINDILNIPVFNSKFALYAPLESPTFTGTVSGITKSMVGLANVDNTSDLNKPISTATQAALDLKANSSDVTTSLLGKADINLSNVSGTSIAADMLPSVSSTWALGSSTQAWNSIYADIGNFSGQVGLRDYASGLPILNSFVTPYLTSTNGAFISGPHQGFGATYDAFGLRGRNANPGFDSLKIIIGTGNAPSGNSGGILLQTGTASGTRGKIQFVDGTEGAGKVWTSDALGNGSWQTVAGSGANTSLSNLTAPTSLNQDLYFFGPNNGSFVTNIFGSPDTTTPIFDNWSNGLLIKTGNNNFGNSGPITIQTGYARLGGATRVSGALTLSTGNGHSIGLSNDGDSGASVLKTGDGLGFGNVGSTTVKTGNCAWCTTGSTNIETGNSTNVASGPIILKPGTGPTRGKVKIQDGSEGTVGHVWTQTAADGSGAWQAVGGSIDPSYVNSTTMSFTQTTSHNTWVDVNGAALTINPSTANEKWEIYAHASLGLATDSLPVAQLRAYLRIVDSSNVLIDNGHGLRANNATMAVGETTYETMNLIARVTLSVSTSYKLQIRQTNAASLADARAYFIVTDPFDNSPFPPKFFAKRVY